MKNRIFVQYHMNLRNLHTQLEAATIKHMLQLQPYMILNDFNNIIVTL